MGVESESWVATRMSKTVIAAALGRGGSECSRYRRVWIREKLRLMAFLASSEILGSRL
jgi:hypothetical protein